MADLLKGVLLQKKDGSRSRAEEVLKDKVVALYFSGHYCLACRDFTPVLKSFYNELLSSEKFEVVFVSSDLTEEDQKKYMEECHGDWYCVPHGSTKCKLQMLPDLENCDCDQEREAERQNSTRSCPGGFPASMTRRAQFPRRSLKELRIDVGKNLEPLVHRARQGLERITEDPSSPPSGDDKPTAPPRSLRARVKEAAPEQPAMSPSASSTSDKPMSERSVAERIEQTLNTHYYTIAYTLVIVAYLVGFAEYLYFRLVSILIPERIAYHPSCEEKQDRRVGKDGFHYGVSIGAFIAIAFFQLICFFALTISENWTVCKAEYNPLNQIVKMQHDLAAHIRRTVSQSMYRTFLCYGICSFINCGIIFYMVAIQDSLGDTVSTVLMYVFDGVVILYFIAFPLTTVIYHPHVHCFQSRPIRAARLPASLLNGIRSQTSTLESNLSQDLAAAPSQAPPQNRPVEGVNPPLEPIQYLESPRRPIRTSTLV